MSNFLPLQLLLTTFAGWLNRVGSEKVAEGKASGVRE